MVLRSGIECYRPRAYLAWRLDAVAGTEERVAVAFSWTSDDGTRTRRAQLLTLRNGKITGIRDYARPTRALRAAAR